MGAFVVAFLTFHFVDKHNAVKVARIEYTIELNKAVEKEVVKRKELEKKLNEEHNVALKEKQDKLDLVQRSLDDAIDRLSKRPSRPSVMPPSKPATVASSCTGRELYKEDGIFLAREAARADKVVVERDFYYNEYERVRKELEKYGNRQK